MLTRLCSSNATLGSRDVWNPLPKPLNCGVGGLQALPSFFGQQRAGQEFKVLSVNDRPLQVKAFSALPSFKHLQTAALALGSQHQCYVPKRMERRVLRRKYVS